jgi:hypothetical protein
MPELFSFPVPNVNVPTLKVTVPVGVMPDTLGVTIEVKAMLWPTTVVMGEAVSAVAVVTLEAVIMTVTGADELVRLVSPL